MPALRCFGRQSQRATIWNMAPTLIATLDGTLHDVTQPLIRADDAGLLRADGVFDVARCLDGRVTGLDEHLRRLQRSAKLFKLPQPDLSGFHRAIDAVLSAWDWSTENEATLRMVITRGVPECGPNSWVALESIPASVRDARKFGIDVLILDKGYDPGEQTAVAWQPSGAKSLGYSDAMAGLRYAHEQAAHDVIFVTPNEAVLEGATSAVLLERDGELCTPRHAGIIESTTLKRLRTSLKPRGLTLVAQPIRRSELYSADGLWLVSSGRLLAPVNSIDGHSVARGRHHRLLREILFGPCVE